ncbi:MAG: T9SS type A sorting domain-containing protein, partial [Candidatus Delongbacteria bacterium]|nr:T9SS type A sorting domain-containing protein [Candidatus Delongbacteria bacterium]
TYPYDESLYDISLEPTNGFSTGFNPTFAIIGFDGTDKIVYWDSIKYADGDLEGTEDFRTALNRAINEFPREGVYLDNSIADKLYEVGFSEDIDISSAFGEYEANPVTITLEGNTDPSAVTATLDGNTLTLSAIGITETSATITLKGESIVNNKTMSFEVYTNDPSSFIGMDQGFETELFPPPFWEIKYNTIADGGLNGANLVDPIPTEETWYNNTTADSSFSSGPNYIHSGDNSALIQYWAPEFNWLISPELQLDYDDYFLKFWIWFDNSYASKFHVLVDDGTKGWTSILALSAADSNHFDSEIELSLSSYHNQTIRIAFVHESNGGMEVALDDITITSPTGINDNGQFTICNLQLEQNYPNPFNPSTMINFSVEEKNHVSLSVFNQNGQLVNTLINGVKESGNYSVNFKANGLSAGIYYYTLTTDNDTISKKMILIK